MVLCHLREEKVRVGTDRSCTSERTSTVELPVPDAEGDDVGQIDRGRGGEQRAGLGPGGASDELRVEQDRADAIVQGDDRDQRHAKVPGGRSTSGQTDRVMTVNVAS